MPTNFPTALDVLTNPTPADNLNTPAVLHSDEHSNENDAIEALEAKVGVDGSAVATSLDHRVGDLEAATHSPVSIGLGGLSAKLQMAAGQILTLLGINHSDLSAIGANDHHNQAHAHNAGVGDAQKLVQANTHESPDTDVAPASLHHTLGTGANQATAGNDSRLTPYTDTEANILAATKTAGTLAYSTDTFYLFVSLGAGVWKKSAFRFQIEAAAPDMGIGAPMTDPSRIGYGETYVSDKLLANVDIGNAAVTTNASATRIPIRASGGTLQIYVNSAWQTIVSNFVFLEDSLWGYALEHKPVGFTKYIEVMSGTSLNDLGLNGLPMINHYNVSMGAYPVPAISGGRTIS